MYILKKKQGEHYYIVVREVKVGEVKQEKLDNGVTRWRAVIGDFNVVSKKRTDAVSSVIMNILVKTGGIANDVQ